MESGVKPELREKLPRTSPPRAPTEPRPHLPRESSSTDADQSRRCESRGQCAERPEQCRRETRIRPREDPQPSGEWTPCMQRARELREPVRRPRAQLGCGPELLVQYQKSQNPPRAREPQQVSAQQVQRQQNHRGATGRSNEFKGYGLRPEASWL